MLNRPALVKYPLYSLSIIMKAVLSIAILVFCSVFAFGQNEKSRKDGIVTHKLAGTWVFDYGEFTFQFNDGRTVKQKGHDFFIDTLRFNENMNYQFITSSSISDSSAEHSGKWKIEDDGSTLILYDRLIDQEPLFQEAEQQLQFPIRIKRSKILKIKFTVYNREDSSQQILNNTPIYFSRVK